MQAAGIESFGGPVVPLEFAEPDELGADEVLVEVRAAGVANWDEFARLGQWDLGVRPPMALGVEAAGVVSRVGPGVKDFRPGDRVSCHSAPLRRQGAWAQRWVVPERHAAILPPPVPFAVAAAFAVPALTAEQVVRDAVAVESGESVLVHGASGVTGRLIVQIAALTGARVIGTAGAAGAARVQQAGAADVLDGRAADVVDQVLAVNGHKPVDVAINTVPGGATVIIGAVRPGGRLATITSDPPEPSRDIGVKSVYVAADGRRLEGLLVALARGRLDVLVGPTFTLAEAAQALARALRGPGGEAVVLEVS